MTLGRLADGLAKRAVDLTVVAPRRSNREDGSGRNFAIRQVSGFPIPRYPELRFGLPARRVLARLWGQDRPDIVHIATEGPLGWSALKTAAHYGIPVASSYHTNFHSYGTHYGFGCLQKGVLWWMRRFHNRTQRTFVPSSDLMDKLERAGFKNLRLLPRGVDTVLFNPLKRDHGLRANWGATPETPVAIHVGRVAAEKNIGLVVRAWHRMKESLPDIKLVLVGDGPERKKLQRTCPEANFAGMRQGDDLAAHYASADCFIFASTTETFGNVITEAMASGLAVLAYGYAAPGRFIRHLHNGCLAPFEDESAFLDTAGRMARLRYRWTEFGHHAAKAMRPHSWDSITEQYLSELDELSSREKPTGQ